jgi:hypothetical protein
MRKSLTLGLLSLVLFAGNALAFTNPPEPSIIAEKKGVSGRKMGEQAAVIMLVRSSHSTPNSVTINSGDAVVYDTNSDDGVSIRHTTTSADPAFCGIAVTAILSSDATSGNNAYDDWGRRNWGFVLVHGKTFANLTAGGGNGAAVGAPLITSGDAGAVTTTVSVVSNGVGSVAEAIARSKGGFFYDSLASDATTTVAEVQIDKE